MVAGFVPLDFDDSMRAVDRVLKLAVRVETAHLKFCLVRRIKCLLDGCTIPEKAGIVRMEILLQDEPR